MFWKGSNLNKLRMTGSDGLESEIQHHLGPDLITLQNYSKKIFRPWFTKVRFIKHNLH